MTEPNPHEGGEQPGAPHNNRMARYLREGRAVAELLEEIGEKVHAEAVRRLYRALVASNNASRTHFKAAADLRQQLAGPPPVSDAENIDGPA